MRKRTTIWMMLVLSTVSENMLAIGEVISAANSATFPADNEGDRLPSSIEELPKAERLFWSKDDSKVDGRRAIENKPDSSYYSSRYTRPKPKAKSDYPNANDEWNYRTNKYKFPTYGGKQVKERDFYHRGINYRDPKHDYSSGLERSSYYEPPPWRANAPRSTLPLLDRIINTGSGLLKFLNPLNYIKIYDPSPFPAAGHHRTPDFYRPPTKYNDYSTYQEPKPSYEVEEVSESPSQSEYDYYSNNNNNNNYDVMYDFDDYDYGTLPSESPPSFKDDFYTKREIESHPQPPPEYDPRVKLWFGKSGSNDEAVKHDSNYEHSDFPSYDLDNIDNIDKVRDRQTLDYLKENKLRDDIYIGRDGNLYLKNTITKRLIFLDDS